MTCSLFSRALATASSLFLALACDGPVPSECADDAVSATCCAIDPSIAGCCAIDPSLVGCAVDCAAHPTDATCLATCEQDPAQEQCRSACEATPLAPHCVPETAGPSAPVEIHRDSLGVPHVYGATDEDAMFGSGYAQATDRLFQMDTQRRRALGRQAEVFGRERLEEDRLMRTMDIAGWSELGAARIQREDEAIYALLVAWTRGVNARIDEVLAGTAPMPEGFVEHAYAPEPFRIMDGIAVGKLVLFGASNQLQNDMLITIVRDYLPEIWETVPFLIPFVDAYTVPEVDRPIAMRAPSPSDPATPPRAREVPSDAHARFAQFRELMSSAGFEGSNNWAMEGRFTANGRSLIAGDPHLALGTPSTMWAQHIDSAEAGGSIDTVGFSFVGTPGVQLGHNASLVWTATLNYPDMMDLWDVRVAGGNVMIGDTAVPIVRRVHSIPILGGETEELLVERVPGRGVLLPSSLPPVPLTLGTRRLLFHWTGFAPTNEFVTFHRIGTATNVDEFETVIDTLEIGAFNWIAADRSNITYLSSIWFPSRQGEGEQPWVMLDGDDASTFWGDTYLPRALLPRSRALTRGWIATANNDPFGWTADGDPTNDAYYFGVYFDSGTREGRIHERLTELAARGDVTPADFETLQTDTHSIFADRLIALLTAAWSDVDTDDALAAFRGRDDLGALVARLAAWDRRMVRDAPEPLLFTVLTTQFTTDVVADELGFAFEPVFDAVPIYLLKVPTLAAEGALPGAEGLFNGEDPRAVLLRSLDRSLAFYATNFAGREVVDVLWSEVHCATVGAAALGDEDGCVPTDGGDGTVSVGSSSMVSDGAIVPMHASSTGATYRMVATFGEDGVPEAQLAFGPGNVETSDSPYYANMLEDWIEGRYRALPFRRAAVDADRQGEPVILE